MPHNLPNLLVNGLKRCDLSPDYPFAPDNLLETIVDLNLPPDVASVERMKVNGYREANSK